MKIIYSEEVCDNCGERGWTTGLSKDGKDFLFICNGCLANTTKNLGNVDSSMKTIKVQEVN